MSIEGRVSAAQSTSERSALGPRGPPDTTTTTTSTTSFSAGPAYSTAFGGRGRGRGPGLNTVAGHGGAGRGGVGPNRLVDGGMLGRGRGGPGPLPGRWGPRGPPTFPLPHPPPGHPAWDDAPFPLPQHGRGQGPVKGRGAEDRTAGPFPTRGDAELRGPKGSGPGPFLSGPPGPPRPWMARGQRGLLPTPPLPPPPPPPPPLPPHLSQRVPRLGGVNGVDAVVGGVRPPKDRSDGGREAMPGGGATWDGDRDKLQPSGGPRPIWGPGGRGVERREGNGGMGPEGGAGLPTG